MQFSVWILNYERSVGVFTITSGVEMFRKDQPKIF